MPIVDAASIAKQLAGEAWGRPVDPFYQLVPGVFRADTPGHGGIVAILAVANLPAAAVQAARMTGRLRQVEGIGEAWIAEEDYQAYALLCSCPAVAAADLVDSDFALAQAEDCCADFVAAYRGLLR